jgi:hypothetical protein
MKPSEVLMNISPFLSVNKPCDESLQWTKQKLMDAELRIVQTFDLHKARADSHNCQCPNHGTEECDCQMVILLVYGKGAEPVTLILHGNGGQTWFSFADDPLHIDHTKLVSAIQQMLEFKAPVLVSQNI